jgi:hypothetical protein
VISKFTPDRNSNPLLYGKVYGTIVPEICVSSYFLVTNKKELSRTVTKFVQSSLMEEGESRE